MKRNAMEHPKLMLLQQRLGVDKPAAVGVLECLWHFTAHYTPDGRIGKYPAAVIAGKIGYGRDAAQLFEALEDAGWLDRTDRGLMIHDWADHCDDAVHLRLARAGLRFADGRMPSLSRLNATERRAARARYNGQEAAGTPQKDSASVDTPSICDSSSPMPGAERMRQDAASTEARAHGVRPAMALAEADAEADADACANAEADTDRESGPAVGSVGSAKRSADEHPNIPAPRPTGTSPVSAAELLPRLLGGFQARQAELPARIVRATGEAAPYRDWWREVIRLMRQHDGADILHEALRHVEDCANPVARAAKDLGTLRAPGAYLASRCRDHLARHNLRLPPPPKGVQARV